MVRKQDLRWSDEDILAVKRYREDVESGRIVPIQLTGNIRDLLSR